MSNRSELELLFEAQIDTADLPTPRTSYRFGWEVLGRKWEADFAWLGERLIVEIEGGEYARGRHTRGKGFVNDCEKYVEAQILGWRVVRFPGSWVKDGKAIQYLIRLFEIL